MQQTIETLITCLPDAGAGELLKRKLTGDHFFTRRVGDRSIDVELTINQVVVAHEGIGAIAYCQQEGLISEDDDLVAFFDLGRNTGIAWLTDYTGETPQVLWKSRTVVEAAGLQRLLSMIATDPEMRSRVNNAPNISLIHDGIVSGRYNYSTKFLFEDIYKRYAEAWLRGIKNPVLKSWQASTAGWLDRLTKIIFIGGAAEVARLWVDDPELNEDEFMVIPQQAQLANILGLLPQTPSAGIQAVIDPGSGWIKVATSTGAIARLESFSSDLYADPGVGELGEDSVFINYVSGSAGKPFKQVYGSSAKHLSLNPIATVNEDKAAIAHKLILAGIGPGVLDQASAGKVATMRRRRA